MFLMLNIIIYFYYSITYIFYNSIYKKDLIFENMEDAQIPSSCIGSLEVDLHARIGRSGQKIEKT